MTKKIIKTIIVDDEPIAREGLELMLLKNEFIEITGICKNGIEAIQILKENQADLLFLDIHMPGINGFEVLDNIPQEKWPFVVFVTAYDDYAIKAFEYHAFDYILKPFTDERFNQMLNRVRNSILSKRNYELSEKYEDLKKDIGRSPSNDFDPIYSDEKTGQKNLIIKDSGKIIILPVTQISCIEAFDYYIKIHYESQFTVTRIPLKNIIPRLPVKQFIRVHRSNVINMAYIESIEKKVKGEFKVKLKSGKTVKVSDTYKKDLMNRFKTN